MERNADDHDPELPSGVSPRQLEEALKWLEELTARQGRPPAADEAPVEPVESPFQGLLQGDEGDLPDWLHEAPGATASGEEEIEVESRLDWLAKMAQRESIEELPTLEWRHLTEPVQNALRPPAADDLPDEAEAVAGSIDNDLALGDTVEAALPTSAELETTIPDATRADSEAVAATIAEAPEAEVAETAVAAGIPDVPEEAPATALVVEAAEPPVEPPAEDLPPLTDLDAAMAWIEELAASQDAPIEDVPSVADRALASKLMLEAGLSPDALDSRALASWPLPDLSLLEGKTPTNPFVEAEDFADTIVLVETMADRGAVPGDMLVAEPPSETAAARVYEAPEPAAEAEAASFDDAMAYLEDLAATRPPEEEPAPPADQAEEPASGLVDLAAKAVAGAVVLGVAATTVLGGGETDPEANEPEGVESEPEASEPLEAEWSMIESSAAPPDDEPDPSIPDVTESPVAAESLLPEDDFESLDAMTEEPEFASDVPEWMEPPAEAEVLLPEDDFDPLVASVVESEFAGDVPEWIEPEVEVSTEGAAVAFAVEAANGAGGEPDAVERRLRALDLLALPPGRTLADVDATLRRSGAVPPHDLAAAIDWLEDALRPAPLVAPAPPVIELVGEDVIARMPEDPDAVLAWLEQFAGEEPGEPPAPPVGEPVAGGVARTGDERLPAVDVTEADLMNMPDDPDEVMAWLEGLAGDARHTPAEPDPVMTTDAPAASAVELVNSDSPEPAVPARSRRRRGRRRGQSAVAEETEALASGAPDDAADTTPVAAPPDVDAPVADVAPDDVTVELATAEQLPDLPREEPEPAPGLALDDAAEVPTVAEAPLADAGVSESETAPEEPVEPAAPEEETPRPLPSPRMRRVVVRRKGAVSSAAEPQATDARPADSPPAEEPAAWIDLLKPLK